MVFHYTIRGGPCLNTHSHIFLESSDITCYVGRDKHENEFLIEYGWPGDVWFHVDSLSSAHVYFRVRSTCKAAPITGIPLDDLPTDSVYDMMQIVKHNSIAGSKLASVKIVYTPHSNLKKTFEMESGAVTYHDRSLCRYLRCDKDRIRVKELEKTKTERVNVDFYEEFKSNQRRIVALKKQARLLGNVAGDDDGNDAQQGVELYDPIQDDVHTRRVRETRQGDDETGVDKALEALEGLSFAPAPIAPIITARRATNNNANAGDEADDDDEDVDSVDDSPLWMQERRDRLRHGSADASFLRARGYAAQEVAEALKKQQCNNGSRSLAALRTLWQSHDDNDSAETDTANNGDDDNTDAKAAQMEEKEVLMAIFGEEEGVVFSDDETEFKFDVSLPITAYEPPDRYEGPPSLWLEVYVDDGLAPHYPFEPPVLALVGGGLPEALLRKLTHAVRQEAVELSKEQPGDPQIFTLMSFVAQEVENLIEQETAELAEEKKKLLQVRKEAAEGERKAQREAKQFKNEQERRAYAMATLASGIPMQEPSEKKKGDNEVKHYNTGVSDESLIKDLFG